MNNQLVSVPSKLLRNKLAKLAINLQSSSNEYGINSNLETFESVITESIKVLNKFYTSLATAGFVPTKIMELTIPDAATYNQTFSDIRDDLEVVFQEFENIPKEQRGNYLFEHWDSKDIILLKMGTKLPLEMVLKGDYFHLMADENNYSEISLEKDLYVLIKNRNFFFSEDLEKWETTGKFFTGNCNLTISTSQDKRPQLEIGSDIRKR